MKNKTSILLLSLIILIGTLFRFYNLNWGSPFYFHPDERNIASSISQLSFPGQMNPNFFAYGSLPIYSIYLAGVLWNMGTMFTHSDQFPDRIQVSFENAIVIGRIYSAFLSIFLVGLIYRTTTILKDKRTGIFAAFLSSFSIGFIQFSHFATFEIWITYCSVMLLLVLIKYLSSQEIKYFILSSVILGMLLSIKISTFVLFLPPVLILIFLAKNKYGFFTKKSIFFFFRNFSLLIIVSFFTWIIICPYNLLDFPSFKNSVNYESSVVLGTLKVFYTGEFFDTTPVLFQFTKIYPFLLNPFLTLLFIPSFIYLNVTAIKTKNSSYLILNTFFIILFFSQAFFYAKWTRNMIPTLPFIYLIISIALNDFMQNFKKISKTSNIYQYTSILVLIIIVMSSVVLTSSYFITTYVKQDTRLSAVDFARQNVPRNSNILSEVYDLGIIPFNPNFQNIKLFNFYNLDNNISATNYELSHNLENYDFIILPSQRILKSRIINSENFPNGHKFYKDLLEEKLGFKKIYETPCDIFCKITYMGNPIYSFEQTVNVFDRPTLFIFKKIKAISNLEFQILN